MDSCRVTLTFVLKNLGNSLEYLEKSPITVMSPVILHYSVVVLCTPKKFWLP